LERISLSRLHFRFGQEPTKSLWRLAVGGDNSRKAAPFGSAPARPRSFASARQIKAGRIPMSGKVVLDFDNQADALRFALAAGSVMAGDAEQATGDLLQETARASRIRLDATNAGTINKEADAGEHAA
jgi:hypothetical protein